MVASVYNTELPRVLERKLTQAGVSKQDMDIGVMLMRALRKIDSIVFPNKQAWITAKVSNQTELGPIVSMMTMHPRRAVKYSVFFKNLYSTLCEDKFSPWFDPHTLETIPINSGASKIPAVVMSLAAHEVRHRMQFQHRDLKLYHENIPIEKSGNGVESLCLIKCRLCQIDRRESRLQANCKRLEESSDTLEFDANYVQQLMLHSYHSEITDEEILKIMKNQPSSTG